MESIPRPQVEKVTEAAILIDGQIFTGQMHFMAMKEAQASLPNYAQVQDSMVQGFVTSTGRFVSREEAGVVADKAEQLHHLSEAERSQSRKKLDSFDLTELKQLTEDFDA